MDNDDLSYILTKNSNAISIENYLYKNSTPETYIELYNIMKARMENQNG